MMPKSNASKRYSKSSCIYHGCYNKPGISIEGVTRRTKLCIEHQCCFMEDEKLCPGSKKADNKWCTFHYKCTLSGCMEPRKLDADGNPFSYCLEHNCTITDCPEVKLSDRLGGTYFSLCTGHLAELCEVNTCDEKKTTRGKYCTEHTCQVASCRRKIASEGRAWCNEHNKCEKLDCSNPRHKDGNHYESLCRYHFIPKCDRPNCNLGQSAGSSFCIGHACNARGCDKAADIYCVGHKCLKGGCDLPRTITDANGPLRWNAFCGIHECQKPGCLQANRQPKSKYCMDHCCTEPGCTTQRDQDQRCGALCWEHYMKREVNAEAERLTELRFQARRDDFQQPRGSQVPHDRRQDHYREYEGERLRDRFRRRPYDREDDDNQWYGNGSEQRDNRYGVDAGW